MCPLQDLTRAITRRYHDKIKRACAPLFDYFNLCDFWHYRIENSGNFYCFGAHLPWSEYSATKEDFLVSPYHRHPKFFQSGVNFLRTVPEDPYLKMLNIGKDKFNVNHCFQLMGRTPDGVEAFGFSSSSSNQLHVALLLNELPLLRLFIKKFREENRFLFSCLEDNQINLAELLGPAFYEEPAPVMPELSRKQSLLRQLGIKIENAPTSREKDVIRLLLEGYSASEIGKQAFLSSRTIEHHLERIKDKLGCDSRAELIQKARELEAYGLL